MTDTILKADVFFVITTVAVIVLSVLISYAVLELIKILRGVRKVSDKFSKEGEMIAEDIGELREGIKSSKITFRDLWSFVSSKKKKGKN